MSQLTKSLEKRIQELTSLIESQKTELAAYQHVLHMELSKEGAPAKPVTIAPELALALSTATAEAREPEAPSVEASEAEAPASEVAYTGNKTALVSDIVKSYGRAGATPKDVEAFFAAKNIKRSTNLIYNTLSYLVARDRLVRRDGKYFLPGTTPAPAKKKMAPAKKKAAAPVKTPAKSPAKRKLSPEGLKRIKEALKKRWADKRAADAAAATKKK